MSAERRIRRRPPSSLIISLLAALADAHPASTPLPTPPPFLCPSIHSHTWSPPSPSSSSNPNPSPTATKILPDRYEKGPDGLWRKVDEYTLYGSTVCNSCRDSTDAAVGANNNPMWPPVPSSSITDSGVLPTVDITDSLPPGWRPTSIEKHTSLTVTISLVLTTAICALIIGCLFLRRVRQRRKLRNADLEMKVKNKRRRHSSDDDSMEIMITKEKEHKSTQALWARATARWKANARYVARQRRGKRGFFVRSSQASGGESTLPESAPTPQAGREDDEPPSAEVEERSPERVPSPESLGPMLPPAYRCRSADYSVDSIDTSIFPIPLFSQSLSLHPRVAHIATDDKAILAQMVDLVSAPPAEEPAAAGVSAPAWPDDGEEFATEEGHCRDLEGTPSMGSPPFMPAPPSKAKMALNYLDHHYLYDDMEPQLGPPAPPFEEALDLPPPSELPSAPPAPFDSELAASAPSWEDDIDNVNLDSSDTHCIPGLPIQGPLDINGRPPGYQPQ